MQMGKAYRQKGFPACDGVSDDLGNVEYPFIAIATRLSLNQSDSIRVKIIRWKVVCIWLDIAKKNLITQKL